MAAGLLLAGCSPLVHVVPPPAPVGSEAEVLERGELDLGAGTGLIPFGELGLRDFWLWPDWDAGWLRAGVGYGLTDRLTLRTHAAKTIQGFSGSAAASLAWKRHRAWQLTPTVGLTAATATGAYTPYYDGDGDGSPESHPDERVEYAYVSGALSAGSWVSWRPRDWFMLSGLVRATRGRTQVRSGLDPAYNRWESYLEAGLWGTFGNPRGLTLSVGLHELWPRWTGLLAPQITLGATWRWKPGERRALPMELPPEEDWRDSEPSEAWPDQD